MPPRFGAGDGDGEEAPVKWASNNIRQFRVAKSVKNRNLYGLIKKSVKCQFVRSLMGFF